MQSCMEKHELSVTTDSSLSNSHSYITEIVALSGTIVGTMQHGLPEFKIANLFQSGNICYINL